MKEVENIDSKIDDNVETSVAPVEVKQDEVTYLEETVAISGENPDEDFEQTNKTEEVNIFSKICNMKCQNLPREPSIFRWSS